MSHNYTDKNHNDESNTLHNFTIKFINVYINKLCTSEYHKPWLKKPTSINEWKMVDKHLYEGVPHHVNIIHVSSNPLYTLDIYNEIQINGASIIQTSPSKNYSIDWH